MDGSPDWVPMNTRLSLWKRLALTVLACGLTVLIATPLLAWLDPTNVVLLFLLCVLLVAVTLGRVAASVAAVLSVLLFDLFFVPPRFSLAVDDAQYLVTFGFMLITGLVTGQLAARLQEKAQESHQREQQARALYEAARRLAGTLDEAEIQTIAAEFALGQWGLRAEMHKADALNLPVFPIPLELRLARIAMDRHHPVWDYSVGNDDANTLFLPLKAGERVMGVFKIYCAPTDILDSGLPEALCSLLAITLIRLHYGDVAQANELSVSVERLRSSILSAISHDLRTPLTAMVGLTDALFISKPPLAPQATGLARAIHEQAVRLTGMVNNLLDMARLNGGDIRLRKEWQPIDDVLGAAINLLGPALADHPVRVKLAPDLPLLAFDAVLLERVICNLLENGAKYAAPGTPLEVEVTQAADTVSLSVADRGPGLPDGFQEDLFAMFTRGVPESGPAGTGLGLAICRAIVEAHGGRIGGENRQGGGARFTFTLPKGEPPTLEEEAP